MANTEKNKVLDLEGLNRYDELLKQLIEAHTTHKDNPHKVTKDQIGLGSVENKSVAEILAAMTSADVTKALGFTPQKQGIGGGNYGYATETEAGLIMSGGDISVSEDGAVTVNSMGDTNAGSDVQPVYFKDGKPIPGHYTLAEAAGKGVTNITAAGNLGWANTSVGGLFVPSINTLAFWNGEYAEGMSNIEYFKLGKFGSMATRSEDDYLETGDIADWAKAENKPSYTYTEVGADKAGSADSALASAKEYALNTVNTKIAELINSAPETMDTLGELAMLMTSNQEAVDILNEAIAKKASATDLTTHTTNKSNPHGVTKAQVGPDKVDNTADADKSVKHAASADILVVTEGTDDVYRNVWFAASSSPNKSVYNAAFQYNPVTDTLKVGNITGKAASATTADALKVTAAVGSATNPVYIDANGKPVKATYTLGASVPSGAKFTDTTYTQATSSALGLVKIGYSENGKNYPVELNSSGQMFVNVPWTDNNTTYGAATSSALGLVKIGSNITNSSGTISLTKANVTAALGYTPPTTNTTYSAATTSAAGLMSAADKSKLDGIAAGANAYTHPNSSVTAGTYRSVTVNAAGHVTAGSNPVLSIAQGGTGKTTASAALSELINGLSIGTDVPVDDDYYVAQYVDGGTTNTTYYRRPVSKLWEYINSKAKSTYLPLAGGSMNTDTSITIPGGLGSLNIGNTRLQFNVPTDGGWARAITYKNNDGTIGLGGIGAFGTGDTLSYYYFGTDYDGAKIKMYNNGNLDLGGNILINGKASADVSATSTNPKITFMDISTQPVHLIYSDYDAYRSPAGLKVVGEGASTSSSPAWFEVEGTMYSKATTIDNKVTLAYSTTTDSLSFNFA